MAVKNILACLFACVPECDVENDNRRAEEKQQQYAHGDQQSGAK
jgi:hypothetical protein